MMELFIDAQDLSQMTLGLSLPNGLHHKEIFFVPPEQYVKTLDVFLKKHQVGTEMIEQISVMPGPGSFTASRVSVTLANTLAFALDIPVKIPGGTPQSFVSPVYNKPPQIT